MAQQVNNSTPTLQQIIAPQPNLPPAKFNPSIRYTFEAQLIDRMIADYWDYLLVELPIRGLVNARELEYLRKSGLVGRFMSDNQMLIDCFRLGCG